MKISVLDRCTVESNGDIDCGKITAIGETSFYDLLTDEEMIELCKDSEAVLVNKKVITAEIMDKLPNLRYIGLFATGYNNIDLAAAKERGITVVNAPGYSTDFVAQTALSYMLYFSNSVHLYNEAVRRGDWINSETFSFFTYPLSELRGKTLGIFGFGNIGRRVARLGAAFGMKVIAYSRSHFECDYCEEVGRERLFRESDFLSIHCPLTPDTKEIINKETLSLMKPTAVLINTSRGGTVNEKDLAEALNSGAIRAAAVDVLSLEPMREDNPLYKAKNCVITPHVAWAARETRERLVALVAANLRAFIDGKPVNVVN